MITTITGLPGNGKTLFALDYVRKFAKDRPVYYSGINDLKLPWIEFSDPEKWMDCPDGCVIVIDESQRAYRPRMHGTSVPRHVAELETHRHRGIDIFLITQNPMLVEANVRRLCGQHFNVIRNFGMERATVHEWQKIEDKPDVESSKARGVMHVWPYPKDLFPMYKSAEVHTHKRRLPKKLLILLVLPFFFFGAIYGIYYWWTHSGTALGAHFKTKEVPAAPAAPGQPGAAQAPRGPDRPKGISKEEYLAQYVPRVPGLEYSAPVYDGITAPVRAPFPAMCVMNKTKGCRCYSEQGTVLSTGQDLCSEIVAKGIYEPYRALDAGAGGATPRDARAVSEPQAGAVAVKLERPPATIPPAERGSGSDSYSPRVLPGSPWRKG